jgi:hypothetical protein
MKLTIESTDQTLELDGVPVRLWRGRHEESGAECDVYIHRVAVGPGADGAAFERELQAKPPPAGQGPWSFPLAAIL